MSGKKVTLRAFKIKPTSDLFTEEKPADALLAKLRESKAAEERRLTLNDRSNTKEQDLIANFQEGEAIKGSVHCLMMRLAIGSAGKQVSKELLKKDSFNLEDISVGDMENSGTEAQYQGHYYFCMTNEYLVTSLPINKTIAGLQAYLNWYLKKLYEITPLIDTQVVSKLSEVTSIEFQDGRLFEGSLHKEEKRTVLSVATEYVKGLFQDAQTVNDTILSKHISATLKISVKKPRASEADEVQQTFGALIKPIADLDNVIIHTKDNGKIAKGDQILLKKIVQVEQLEGGLLNEPELRQAMELFLQEIAKCESATKE